MPARMLAQQHRFFSRWNGLGTWAVLSALPPISMGVLDAQHFMPDVTEDSVVGGGRGGAALGASTSLQRSKITEQMTVYSTALKSQLASAI